MSRYDFEPIEHNNLMDTKVFFAEILSLKYHWHYDYEFILVIKGHISVQQRQSVDIYGVGDIILINSHVIHSLQDISKENLCMIIQIPRIQLTKGLKENQYYYIDCDLKYELNKTDRNYQDMIRLLIQIGEKSFKQDIVTIYEMEALVRHFLAAIFRVLPYEIRTVTQYADVESRNQLIKNIIDYAEKYMDSETLKKDLCLAFGIGENTLYRYLKAELGLTLKELVQIHRIERVKWLLREGQKSIGSIMDICGFSNEATFYRVFKHLVGLTPKVYQQQGYMNHEKLINRNDLGLDNECILRELSTLAQKMAKLNQYDK